MICQLHKNTLYTRIAEHAFELDYIIGTIINDLTNRVQSNSSLIQLSDLSKTVITVWWNYQDGLYDFMLAASQLTNTTDYRRTHNIIKGSVNAACGVQFYIFTYNPPLNQLLGLSSATGLAGISFAVGTLLDLMVTSLDFYVTIKMTYFKGWLNEKIQEYNYAVKKGYDTKDLVNDIRHRCKVYINQDPLKYAEILRILKQQISDNIENETKHAKLIKDLDIINKHHKVRNREIQLQLDQEYKDNRTGYALKATSFVGMTFLAVTGFIRTPDSPYSALLGLGLAMTSVVASHYLITNSEYLMNTAGKIGGSIGSSCYSFFQSPLEAATNVTDSNQPSAAISQEMASVV